MSNRLPRALDLKAEMLRAGLSPNERTFGALLRCCWDNGRSVAQAADLFREALRAGMVNAAAIDCFAKAVARDRNDISPGLAQARTICEEEAEDFEALNRRRAGRSGGGGRGGFGSVRACYNCGEGGHISRDCPQPRQGGGGDRARYT